ncbi:MAG: hypothetical protein J6K62_03125 [Clostridia bacterium]|nr:hypothetical protein [Clostridia bacterium]
MKNDLLKRALRLYGRCVLSTVLGTFMYFSVGIITHAITPDTATLSPSASFLMHLVVLILQAFLSLTIIYAEMWKQGDKDGGPVMFGGAAGDPHLGLKVGLLSAVPAFVGYILIILEKLIGFWPAYMQLYRASNFALYPIIVWTLGERANVPAADCSWVGILLSVIPTVVIVLASWGFYYIGYRQFTFAQKLMYKNNKNSKNKLR